MATSGACEGRLWLRGWCLRTRSLREQINTAAPCTWTFLPLRRLVPSPFLSVFISRRFSGLRVCSSFSPSLLPPSPSLPLACSPLSFSSLRRSLSHSSSHASYTQLRMLFTHIPRVSPISFSLSFTPGASLCLARRERIQLVLPTYVHPRFHPRVRNDRRRFLFAFVSPRGIFLPCFFPKLAPLALPIFHNRLSWH